MFALFVHWWGRLLETEGRGIVFCATLVLFNLLCVALMCTCILLVRFFVLLSKPICFLTCHVITGRIPNECGVDYISGSLELPLSEATMESSTNACVDHFSLASRPTLTRTEMNTGSNLRPSPPLQTAVINPLFGAETTRRARRARMSRHVRNGG
jgi:hypothetical protein